MAIELTPIFPREGLQWCLEENVLSIDQWKHVGSHKISTARMVEDADLIGRSQLAFRTRMRAVEDIERGSGDFANDKQSLAKAWDLYSQNPESFSDYANHIRQGLRLSRRMFPR